jgi:tetratricopeptide (TPR) repeat protein
MVKNQRNLAKSNSTNGLLKQSLEPAVNTATLQRLVQAHSQHLRADALLGLTELAREVGVKPDTLLYWGKLGILQPISDHKGERAVEKYPLAEIKKAYAARELQQKWKYKPAQITAALAFFQGESSSAGLPSAQLDQAGRAQMLLAARLLALVVQLAGGLKMPPPDCLLLVRQLTHSGEMPGPNEVRVVEKGEKQVEALAGQKSSIVGIASTKGEVHLYFREKIQEKISGRTYVTVQLRGNSDSSAFEIIYGFKPINGDGQISQLRRNLVPDRMREVIPIHKYEFLIRLLHFTCTTVIDLEAKVASYLPENPNILQVLSTAVTLIAPDKWDFASFLTPVNSGTPTMKVLAASVNYPPQLKEQLYTTDITNDQIPSLPGWVFTHGDNIVIENIAPNDLRLLDENSEGLKALAIIPAVVLGKVEGVILVGSQTKLPEDRSYFDQAEIKILYILARIIAEAQAREKLTQADDKLLMIPDLTVPEQGEVELRQALRSVVDTIIPHARAEVGMDNSVILLAVRVEGYGRFFTLDKTASEWFTYKVQRTLHHQLEYSIGDDWESPLPSRVFKLAGDQFVGLIGRTREDVRRLRQDIGERLNTLRQLISSQHSLEVAIHVWSVHFTYNNLALHFHLAKPNQSSPDDVVAHLLERTKGAIKIVANIQRGDTYMRHRDYPVALAEYDIAARNDPNNPYVLRHKCECLTEMGLYDEAVRYGLLAVEHDPEYAGSYRRLADAFVELRDFDKALENYHKAIQYAENDPVTYLSLAQALILRTDPNDLGKIIDTLSQAMGYDAPDDYIRARYLRYKGDACLRYREYRQATTWYGQALRFDSENEVLHWKLKSAHHQDKASI